MTDIRIGAEVGISHKPNLKLLKDPVDSSSYTQFNMLLNVELLHLWGENISSDKSVFLEGGPIISAGYLYTGGDANTRGSYRRHGQLFGGVKQYLLSWFFVQPRVGLSAGEGALNFGKGFLPEADLYLTFLAQAYAGVELYSSTNKAGIALTFGPYWEKSIQGPYSYENRGLNLNFVFSFGMGETQNHQPDETETFERKRKEELNRIEEAAKKAMQERAEKGEVEEPSTADSKGKCKEGEIREVYSTDPYWFSCIPKEDAPDGKNEMTPEQ